MSHSLPKTIWKQVKQDLIGKDAFRGVTLSYSWLANQFGHFALGFIPAIILYLIFGRPSVDGRLHYWPYLPAAIIWGAWFIFEVLNFFYTISTNRKTSVILKAARKNFYGPRRWHFRRDWCVDLCFFAFGALAACYLFIRSQYVAIACLGLVPVLVHEFIYWYAAKIYLQRALYPFQYRLSQWDDQMSDKNRKNVQQFMESSFCGMQLLVLGEDDDEKIRLCTGIGSELSYERKKCRYLTTMKAFECFYREVPQESRSSHKFSWSWQEADLLIIDDINPSHAKIEEVITADEFFKKIDNEHGTRNKKCLREKKLIWMLGNETEGNIVQEEWKDMLVRIGVDRSNIITVNLTEKPQDDDLHQA